MKSGRVWLAALGGASVLSLLAGCFLGAFIVAPDRDIRATATIYAFMAESRLQTAAAPVVRTVAVTQLVEITRQVTRIVYLIVTVTPSPPPRFTPTALTATLAPTRIQATPVPAGPPTETPLPAPTIDVFATATAAAQARLTASKGSGFYLVNVDIAPGVWRSQGTGNACYWSRTTLTGDIIDNHFGMSGGTIFIAPSDFQVQLQDCGTWVYLGPP